MTPGKRLMKDLALISARILQNTRMAPAWMESKLELIRVAYGGAAVQVDFADFCREHLEEGMKWPIIEYVKVVDSRLGKAPAEKRPDPKDPRIAEIMTRCYEITGELPSTASIANLLLDFTPEEIIGALDEYAEPLTEKEVGPAMRKFFSEGGAAAVILARRRRK